MTMRECPDGLMRDELPGYVLGTLSAEDRARVEAHVASCNACAAEVDLLRAVGAAYRAPAVDMAGIASAVRTATAVARSPEPGARTFTFGFSFAPARLAAALVLLVSGLVAVVLWRRPDRSLATAPEQTAPVVAVPAPMPERGAPGAPARARDAIEVAAAPELSLGGGLSDLSNEQLRSLLAALDSLEASPRAEPEAIATPIIPDRVEPRGGRLQ